LLKKFLKSESMGGVVLLVSAAIALIWSNSAALGSYEALMKMELGFRIGHFVFERNVHFLINDGLMTFFFLVAGMEMRHALHDGALANMKQAALPLVAACGGVAMPALIFVCLNGEEARLIGWAIPTATDIAFAIGVLALLGRAIPADLRIILLSLAIIDDVIAVVIIALFYSDGLDMNGAVLAMAGVAWVFLWQRIGVASAWGYCLPAIILWFGLLKTGIHPSLAGVILGLVTPPRLVSSRIELLGQMARALRKLQNRDEKEEQYLLQQIRKNQRDLIAPIIRVPLVLQPWVSFGVMPIFAFANAGVPLTNIDFSHVGMGEILFGVGGGLLIGKPLGVLAASYLAVKIGLCRLPPQLDWMGMTLIGLLAGIGFTMAIFVAMLAYADPYYLAAAKIGILVGSCLSVLLGLGFGLFYCARRKNRAPDIL